MVSLLKAWWGDAATADNDFGFGWLPRISGDHSNYQTIVDMLDGKVEGYFLLGQNPAVGSANGKMQRLAMSHLKWLVVRDLNLIESATFWKDGPEIATGEMRTEDIGTEVFFLPAAAHTEKDGTFTQTQRLLQWHHKAVEPPGDCRSDLHFFYHLGRLLRERLATSRLERDAAAAAACVGLPTGRRAMSPTPRRCCSEINGRHLSGERAGQMLSSFVEMKADGSTSGGCWIYTGVYADGVNQSARRKPGSEQSWVAPEWAWAWPMNRRILYNRASADPEGKPWSERKAYVWWDADRGEVDGARRARLPASPKRRRSVRSRGSAVPEGLAGDDPFIMQADGKGWLYAPSGLLDGPLPVHYEPVESPVRNALLPSAGEPDARDVPAQREPHEPVATGAGLRRVPVRRHHLPAHRASHRGWHEPVVPVPRRIAAGVLLRGLAGARRRARARAPAAGRRSSPRGPPSRRGCWSPTG